MTAYRARHFPQFFRYLFFIFHNLRRPMIFIYAISVNEETITRETFTNSALYVSPFSVISKFVYFLFRKIFINQLSSFTLFERLQVEFLRNVPYCFKEGFIGFGSLGEVWHSFYFYFFYFVRSVLSIYANIAIIGNLCNVWLIWKGRSLAGNGCGGNPKEMLRIIWSAMSCSA